MTLDPHHSLDWEYPGDAWLRERLSSGLDPGARRGQSGETLLHVAARRRRSGAVHLLLAAGADPDTRTHGGKTAWQHAARRGFTEIAELLASRGADTETTSADRLAIALSALDLDTARRILEEHPGAARTGNPEEDRLLADVAGRQASEPVRLLLSAGADLRATGLDGGTPLHQAAWFGQPGNAILLVEAGAPLDVFDPFHGASPIGWVTHGSRYSGGADERVDAYVSLARLLTSAGCSLFYPDDSSQAYLGRLLADAVPAVAAVIRDAA